MVQMLSTSPYRRYRSRGVYPDGDVFKGEIVMGLTTIVKGFYVYISTHPKGCIGHVYEVVDTECLSVPENSHKVLCKAITGPHAGLHFVCSPVNFSLRYRPAQESDFIGNGLTIPGSCVDA